MSDYGKSYSWQVDINEGSLENTCLYLEAQQQPTTVAMSYKMYALLLETYLNMHSNINIIIIDYDNALKKRLTQNNDDDEYFLIEWCGFIFVRLLLFACFTCLKSVLIKKNEIRFYPTLFIVILRCWTTQDWKNLHCRGPL